MINDAVAKEAEKFHLSNYSPQMNEVYNSVVK
jgi:DNA/RNA endonuclease G (NUC1)